jgi:hypothetical protein
MRNDHPRHWREICLEVVREKNSSRLSALLEELLTSLEAMKKERKWQLKIEQHDQQRAEDASD